MTEHQINVALALAIGWHKSQLSEIGGVLYVEFKTERSDPFVFHSLRPFSYTDPAVIWPIAERYFAFPSQYVDSYGRCVAWEASVYIEKTTKNVSLVKADTAAKAVALAVIGSRK